MAVLANKKAIQLLGADLMLALYSPESTSEDLSCLQPFPNIS